MFAIGILMVIAMALAACTTKEQGSEMPKIGFTIYKYDDNFMSFVRRAIENVGRYESNHD